MGKANPPYGILDELFAGPRESRRQAEANRRYWEGYYRGKGQRDGSRRK